MLQVAESRLPALLHGNIAANHRNFGEVTGARIGDPVAQKKLTAPDRAVVAVSSTVKADGEYFPLKAVFGND